jgi:hypothetical protein
MRVRETLSIQRVPLILFSNRNDVPNHNEHSPSIPFFSLRAGPFGPDCILDKHAHIEFVFDSDTIAHNCANPLFAEDKANPGPFVKRAMKTDTQAGRRDVKNTPGDCWSQ